MFASSIYGLLLPRRAVAIGTLFAKVRTGIVPACMWPLSVIGYFGAVHRAGQMSGGRQNTTTWSRSALLRRPTVGSEVREEHAFCVLMQTVSFVCLMAQPKISPSLPDSRP